LRSFLRAATDVCFAGGHPYPIFTHIFPDDAPVGSEPNTVSLRREIPVIDRNDNPPKFEGRPYLFSVVETARVGSVVYEGVVITDADSGVNGELGVSCDPVRSTPNDACDTFDIKVIERTRYPGTINRKN
jgi:hypothetical protein